MRLCKQCQQQKDTTDFYSQKSRKDGLTPQCKSCRSEMARQYRERHPDYMTQLYRNNKARVKEYQKNNPDKYNVHNHSWRAKQYNRPGSFTEQEWLAKLEEYNNQCAYCGVTGKKLDKEHFIPLTDPRSTNYIDNIVPACRSCNQRKGSKPPEQWQSPREHVA